MLFWSMSLTIRQDTKVMNNRNVAHIETVRSKPLKWTRDLSSFRFRPIGMSEERKMGRGLEVRVTTKKRMYNSFASAFM